MSALQKLIDYGVSHELTRMKEAQAELDRAIELLRACNKTGGVVVELYKGRYLRDWITEYLNDGKVAMK